MSTVELIALVFIVPVVFVVSYVITWKLLNWFFGENYKIF